MIEIEKKFQVEKFDKIRESLASGKFDVMHRGQSVAQTDEYFNHRQLRFDLQDIALRIRQIDDRFLLTFKGPNQDPNTKIRSEIEVDFDGDDAKKMSQMFLGMGMHSVAKVCKLREAIQIRWQEATVEVCLDAVDEVGYFVELEIVAESQDDVAPSIAKLETLAQQFGLSDSTTTSYLVMLLQGRGQI